MTNSQARMMTGLRGLVIAAGIAGVLAACTPTINNHGRMVREEDLASISVGLSTKEQVASVLGSPSSISNFDDRTWYYIGQRTEQTAFFKPDTTEQEVLAIDFDDLGLVTKISKLGLDQSRDLALSPRETPAAGKSFTLLQQLLGNLGRFNERVFDDSK